MQSEFIYCPIIKGKINDIKALAYVSPSLAGHIKPLYELPPFKPTDELDKVIGKFALRLQKLNGRRSCYVDFPLLRPGLKSAGGEPALSIAYGQLNLLGVPFEPAFGFDRDDSLWDLVIGQAQRSGGLLLRLDRDDLEFPLDTRERIIELSSKGVDLARTDVMVDCRAFTGDSEIMAVSSAVADFVDALYRMARIRRILVAGSSAPKTVASVERDSCSAIPRRELEVWARVAAERLPVQPVFADYGVIHPDFSDLTMATHINGKIRYTAGGQIYIHRGHSLRESDKYAQYRTLSTNVIRSPHYKGSSYSYGDRYVYECATGHTGTGNPGTWVLVDQNHHITVTAHQLERLTYLANAGNPAEALLAGV